MDTMNEVIGERSSFIGFLEFGLLQRGQQFALHFEISSTVTSISPCTAA